ncbi:hypothetical protein H4S07_007011, partial [Coemansia furcata]
EERRRLETGRHDLERAKSDIEALLISERSAAVDQEEILKRTQEREVELAERLREHEGRVDDLEEQCVELGRAKAELEQRLAAVAQQMESEVGAMRDLASQHEQNNEALSSASAEAAEYRAALERIEADHSEALERIGELETFLAQSRDIEAQAAQELVHMQQELAQKDSELSARSDAEVELASRTKQAAAAVGRLEADLAEALKQRDAVAVEREGVSVQLSEALAACDALEKESGGVGLRLAAAEQTLGNAQQEKQRLTEANARLVAEIDELRRLIDEKADQGTRESEMRRMREGELSALRSELNDTTSELEDFRRAHIEAEEAL